MQLPRRRFLRTLGLSALGLSGASVLNNLFAQEPTNVTPALPTAPWPTSPALGGAEGEIRTALPATADYEINAHFVNKGPGFGRRIALTFDDGPNPGTTAMVLEELRKREIKATFFMIGQRVKMFPEIAREVFAAGHEIGNHSFTHPALSKMSTDKVEHEIQSTQEAIYSAINQLPTWFRPPYGAFRKDQGPIAAARQLGVTYWSVDPNDWRKPGVEIVVARVLNETRPGSIVLLHDIHKSTVEAVPAILDGLIERGFEFTSISGFLGNPYSVS